MRQLCPALGFAILLAGWDNLAGAQAPASLPALDYPSPLAINTASPCAGSLPGSDLDAQAWSVNLLLGLPTGVRVQRALGDDVGRDWLVEGFAGLELIFPMAGSGIRRRFTPFGGDRDSLTVSPGVDAYVVYAEGWFDSRTRTVGLFTADVEVFWQHAFNDRWRAQLGINLGAGASTHGQGSVVPVASFIYGLRF